MGFKAITAPTQTTPPPTRVTLSQRTAILNSHTVARIRETGLGSIEVLLDVDARKVAVAAAMAAMPKEPAYGVKRIRIEDSAWEIIQGWIEDAGVTPQSRYPLSAWGNLEYEAESGFWVTTALFASNGVEIKNRRLTRIYVHGSHPDGGSLVDEHGRLVKNEAEAQAYLDEVKAEAMEQGAGENWSWEICEEGAED